MATLRRSPQAHLDLLQIWLYVAERDPRAADRLLDRDRGQVPAPRWSARHGTGAP
jgi:plasmid stabilization system protein ParE